MVNLNRLKKIKFYIEHFNGVPALTEMTGAGFTSKLYNSSFLAYSFCISYYKNGQGDWLTTSRQHKEIGSFIVTRYMKNKNEILKLYGTWVEKYPKLMENFQKSFSVNLSDLSNDELLEWTQGIYNFYRFEISMPGFLDGFMFYADSRLDYILKNFCNKKGIKEYQKIYSLLSAPTELSFIARERIELKKISSIKDKEKFNKALSRHLLNYAWLKSSYVGYIPYTKKMALEEIEMLNDGFKKIDFKKIKTEKNALIKKYKFTPEIISFSELAETFTKWQDLRKEYTLTFVTLLDKILCEISRRRGISRDLLDYCKSDELPKILAGKFPLLRLKERMKGCIFVYKKGKIQEIFVGKKAESFFEAISRVKTKDIKLLKGFVANIGMTKGTVKIVRSIDDVKKVKSGDILVSPMTRPEHLIAMKKAVAIITDDGGITCHAAIVARELGIPCVIGTKIATKVLSDGDLVEVNANNGTVKIIK